MTQPERLDGRTVTISLSATTGRREFVRRRSVLIRIALFALAVAVVGVTVTQLLGMNLPNVLRGLRFKWLAAASVAAGLSIFAAMHNLAAFCPIQLSRRDNLRAQLAICGIRVVTPSALSTPAVCARYLNRSGLPAAESLAVVGTAQAAQLMMTVVVVAVVAGLGWGGSSASGSAAPLAAGVVLGVLAIAAAVLALTKRRFVVLKRIGEATTRAVAAVTQHVRSKPMTAVSGLAASGLLTLTHVAAFVCCVAATGGHVSLVAATAVYLTAAGAGSLVPTPGGIGAVEAAMVAGLVAAGSAVTAATAATVLVRLVMTWALVPPGLMALRSLRRRQLL